MTRHGKAPVIQSAEEGSSSTRGPDSVTVGTTQQSGQSQEEEITFAGETVGQIETLIESFRTGNSTKTQTIIKINQILAGEQIGDERSKLDSLERYGKLEISLTASKPSLLSRLNMDNDLSTPFSESERKSLVTEVNDMKQLTGILPET